MSATMPWWRRSGVDVGDKHVGRGRGATENTVVVQALLDNSLARGLDPTLPRLFIVDGEGAHKAIRNTFGVAAAIQRCQVHMGRSRRPCICMRREGAPSGLGPGRAVAERLAHRPGVWSMRPTGASRAASWSGMDEILAGVHLQASVSCPARTVRRPSLLLSATRR